MYYESLQIILLKKMSSDLELELFSGHDPTFASVAFLYHEIAHFCFLFVAGQLLQKFIGFRKRYFRLKAAKNVNLTE